jgi:hypothetical protein
MHGPTGAPSGKKIRSGPGPASRSPDPGGLEAAAQAASPGPPTPKNRLPRRIPGLAAAALFLLYLSVLGGHQVSIDGMLMQHEARSLVVDGSMRFRSPVWTWDGNAMWNSQYGIGQTLLYLPGYFVAAPLAPLVPSSATKPKKLGHYYYDQAYRDPLYTVGGSWIFAAITSAAAFLIFELALALGASPRAALWSMAFYGLGSTAFVYARGDFSQPLIGLCWTAGLLTALRFRDSRRAKWLWVTAAVVAYAILSRPFEGLLLVPAVLVVMLPARIGEWDRRVAGTFGAVGAGVLAAAVVTLLVNFGRFGELFHFGYTERARWIVPELATLAAVLVSPARGILWQFPAILLAVAGAVALVRRPERGAFLAIVFLAASMLTATACWHVWWGGWCYGLRLFVPAIAPLAAVAALGVDALGSRARRIVPGLVLALGFAWVFPCALVDSLAGYAKAHDGGVAVWKLTGFPFYGVWQYLRRASARDLTDIYGIDIVWVRTAHLTDGWSLIVPAVLVALALAAAFRCRHELLSAER